MTITETDIDDLFAAPARRPAVKRTARITCRVCECSATVPIDAPAKLCTLCAEDLDRTTAHITARYDAAAGRHHDAWERLDADVAHADEATVARWQRYLAALETPPALETRERVRAGVVAGPFADLVRRHLDTIDAAVQLSECMRWRDIALEEVYAATAAVKGS